MNKYLLATILVTMIVVTVLVNGCVYSPRGGSQWNAYRYDQRLQNQQQFQDFYNRTTVPRTRTVIVY